jgi:hypothetical protein
MSEGEGGALWPSLAHSLTGTHTCQYVNCQM